jgi:hypothetical protein
MVRIISLIGVDRVDAISGSRAAALNPGARGSTGSLGALGALGHESATAQAGHDRNPSTSCAGHRWNTNGRQHAAECATNFLQSRKYA